MQSRVLVAYAARRYLQAPLLIYEYVAEWCRVASRRVLNVNLYTARSPDCALCSSIDGRAGSRTTHLCSL